jgi:5'(3')-deoxyribonucleotidase
MERPLSELKPQVGIDLDGVLADFISEYMKISRKLFHKPPKNYVWDSWGPKFVTKEEDDRVWRHIKHTHNFWLSLEKMENTNALMRRQKEMNLFFITSRVPTDGMSVMEQSMEWLARNYCIPGAYVAVSSEKGKECKALDLDFFLDDKPEYCTEISHESPKTKVFLQDRLYNKDYHGKGVTRVANINEFIKRVLD